MAFNEVGINISFTGEGVNEVGHFEGFEKDTFESATGLSVEESTLKAGDVLISIDPEYFRPTEVDLLIGDAEKAKNNLGWTPKYDLNGLVSEMVAADVNLFKKDLQLMKSGYRILKQAE
jgi:GDPmannose 4,6-dehydratase